MLLCFVLGLSLYAIAIFTRNLQAAATSAPVLPLNPAVLQATLAKLSVIIPAYNEAENIEACVTAVLDSSTLSAEQLEIWMVDDQSTDETLAIAQLIQETRQDPRLHVLAGQPRPEGEVWMGKNWACEQAIRKATGEFLLFIDADLTVKPGGLESAVSFAQEHQTDLLTFWMTIACECWAEWIAQPIIASLFAVGFKFAEVNDPTSATVFAVGPFMLFRRTAYDQIGGHRDVAAVILEDVTLGRRIKQHRLKLWYGLGHDIASVRMYQSFAALWEGWTKNFHLGTDRNFRSTLYIAFVAFMVFALPWVGLVFLPFSDWQLAASVLIGIAIALHYHIRRLSQRLSNIPTRYWWLSGVGGLLVSAIAIASIIKVETGWGWTWRGRPLKQEPETGM